jgi:hypothetical protein
MGADRENREDAFTDCLFFEPLAYGGAALLLHPE